jgi:hypothetical protein
MGAYGNLLGGRLKLNLSQSRPFRRADQFANADSGLFWVTARGNLLPSNEDATRAAAGYRQGADGQPVWKPNANDIRGIIGFWGAARPVPDPPVGGRQG